MPLRGAGAEGALLPFTQRRQGHLRAPLRDQMEQVGLSAALDELEEATYL